jgi:hypothetical protein
MECSLIYSLVDGGILWSKSAKAWGCRGSVSGVPGGRIGNGGSGSLRRDRPLTGAPLAGLSLMLTGRHSPDDSV